MKSSIGIGLMLLSVLAALSFEVAFAEMAKDKVEVVTLLNATNATGNITEASEPPLNITNTTELQGIAKPENTRDINNIKIDGPDIDFTVKPLKLATFVIKSFENPVNGETKKDQSLLNAALTVRAVEKTPHGYVTYYN